LIWWEYHIGLIDVMTLKWKQKDVFKTAGTIIKVGTYQGDNRDDHGKLYQSTFDKRDIRLIHNNINEPIPIHVDMHGSGIDKRTVVGYAFRVGISDDENEIAHNGFVFDQKAQKLIAGGYNKISPEITTIKDSDGKIVDRIIDAICFVPDGAIDGNDLFCVAEKFSSPDKGAKMTNKLDSGSSGDIMDSSEDIDANQEQQIDYDAIVKKTAENLLPSLKTMIDDAVSKVGQNTQGAEIKVKETDVDKTESDHASAELRAELESQRVITDRFLDEKLTEISNQLTELGIEDPSSIVKDLPKLKAIDLLEGMLAKIRISTIKNSSMSGVPKGIGNKGSKEKTQQDLFKENMIELGLNSEKYMKMFSV